MNVVTGAFSYTGSYIARGLLARGERVKTLSRKPDPSHPLSSRIDFAPLRFDDERALADGLRGASTLYNTYWIRFPRSDTTWETVVANTRVLLRAAAAARVRRIVHLSVANASAESPFPYFRYKALAERDVRDAPLSHAIVRPTLIFGREDILINNIAWALRRFPVFLIPGNGRYGVQPVSADDVAELAIEAGHGPDDVTLEAGGPVVYAFEDFVETIRASVRARCRLVHVAPGAALFFAELARRAYGDVMVTRDELQGLMADLLVSRDAASGETRFEDWLAENGDAIGAEFVSELERNWYERPA